MKNLKKRDILSVILCLCMIIPGAVVYHKLPERIVTNWNIRMEESHTMPKAFVVFMIPIICAALGLICCMYAEKLAEKQKAGKLIPVLQILLPVSLCIGQGTILLYALGTLADIRFPLCLFISVILISVGNYMPKIRRNWFVGIRTPHIVKNEEVWYKTHRLAGMMCTLCGIIGLVTTFLGYFNATIVILLASVLIPTVYGEVIYYLGKRKE